MILGLGPRGPGFNSRSSPFLFPSRRDMQTKRQRGDSNPCGQSPMDFESISLTTRTQCHACYLEVTHWLPCESLTAICVKPLPRVLPQRGNLPVTRHSMLRCHLATKVDVALAFCVQSAFPTAQNTKLVQSAKGPTRI